MAHGGLGRGQLDRTTEATEHAVGPIRSPAKAQMVPLDDIFEQIAAVLLVAAVVGALVVRLRQPLIIGFIAVGILVGPSVLDIVSAEHEEIELLAGLGIALLLFVVGLRLDLHLIRTTGPVALATGLGQVTFTSALGFLIALALGLDVVPALYVAVALTFSSTIIIVKLLSDKKEIDDLHGRIAVGLLIVQDIVVVFAMIALTAVGAADTDRDALTEALLVVGKGVAFLTVIALLMRFALTPLLHQLARSQELLVLFAIAWAVALAATGEVLGFSREVGAFLGGVSLASTPYREAIASRLVGLRDFLLLFFFVDLGSQLDIGQLGDQLAAAAVLSAFVLIGNPLIVMAIMGRMRYRRRVSFLTGLTVAQISEFSLILAALGLTLGHIGSDTVALITTVGLITIATSTYMIIYSHELYDRLGFRLHFFERSPGDLRREDEASHAEPAPDVILYGLGRYGASIGRELREDGYDVLGVDFDPVALGRWQEEGGRAAYGDAEDPELPTFLPLTGPDWVISSVPRRQTNQVLLHALHHHRYPGRIAVTAQSARDAEALERDGADLVLRPFVDAAAQVARRLESRPARDSRRD
jgi:Kef-type K+ transport system membrane component KefB